MYRAYTLSIITVDLKIRRENVAAFDKIYIYVSDILGRDVIFFKNIWKYTKYDWHVKRADRFESKQLILQSSCSPSQRTAGQKLDVLPETVV